MTKLVALGDSIFEGWDGKEEIDHSVRIPELIGKQLGWEVDNEAISGATLSGSAYRDFVQMCNKLNFANYDVCLINYGVNDFSYRNVSLDVMKSSLNKGVQKIRKDNYSIRIMYELPTQDLRFNRTSMDDKGPGGWSQNELGDALIQECKALNINYYDWRPNPIITYQNGNETLGDGNTGVHPTKETMVKMAERLSLWLNSKGLVGYYTTNLENIYGRTSQLYGDVNGLFMNDDAIGYHFEPIQNPTGERGLAVYLWTIKSLETLEKALNELIGMFNGYSLIDVTTGLPTDFITLWIPTLDLVLDDDYKKKLDNDFKLANDLLDRLFKYIQPYI